MNIVGKLVNFLVTLVCETAGRSEFNVGVLVSGWEVNYKEEFIPTDDGSYSVIIQRRKKISGHEGPIRNSFTCKEPGNIVLTIENGALIKKKRICYRYKMMNRSSS